MCVCVCLCVCVSAASLDPPAGETRAGDPEDSSVTTGGGEEDPAGCTGGVPVRGTYTLTHTHTHTHTLEQAR